MDFRKQHQVVVQKSGMLTYREGDGQIYLISDICDISLSEEAWQADFGTIYR